MDGADDFPMDPQRNYAIPFDNPFVGLPDDDEIWVYGLRNPWRPSFDRDTGDLWIADVGQNWCEEVNVQPAASLGGENYGWRLREGTIQTPTGGVGGNPPPGAIDPIMDYTHTIFQTCAVPGAGTGFTGSSVTGGYVYRGPVASLDGRYFFADYARALLWSLVWDGTDPTLNDGNDYSDLTDHSGDPDFTPDVGAFSLISSFGEDDAGNLYIVDLDGEIFLLPEPAPALMPGVGFAALLALRRLRARRP